MKSYVLLCQMILPNPLHFINIFTLYVMKIENHRTQN